MKLFKINNFQRFLLLFLPVIVTIILFGYSLVYVAKESLATEGLASYISLFTNKSVMGSFLFSINVSLIATVLSVAIGFAVSKLLFYFLLTSKWKLLVWLPMLVPHFVSAYLVLLFLSPSGMVSSLFYHLELIVDMDQFAELVFDQYGIGIIVAYVWKSVPFVVLMLLPSFYEIDRKLLDVVKMFTGGKYEAFKMVEWPWLFPIIIETSLILFAFIFSAFEIPFLLGVTEPKMISVNIYQWFYSGDWEERPKAFAAMIAVTVVIFLLAYFSFKLTKKTRYALMRGH